MERQEKRWSQLVEFTINKLKELKIKAEFEDRKRGKKRYIRKTQAYQDLINLIEGFFNEKDN